MTLVIGLANQQHTIFISDRRLTRAGKLADEESNKAATLVRRDARVAICFCGLADVHARSIGRAKTFLTRQWLLEALVESAQPDYLIEPIISRFCLRATQDIETLAREHDEIAVKRGQPKLDKRLSVLIGGYYYAEDPPRCYFSLISNFESFDRQQSLAVASNEFTVSGLRESRPSTGPLAIGVTIGSASPLDEKNVNALRPLLIENKPAEAIVGKGVEVLRMIADSPRSRNSIGKQCMSIVLPRDPQFGAVAQYHSAMNASTTYYPSHIEARGGEFGAYVLESPSVKVEDPAGQELILEVPKAGRNQPCPCRSGKKYKKCHGALPGKDGWSVRFGS